MKIAVIIPTLNEVQNIGELIPRIHDALQKEYTAVVVDDNSGDGTPQRVSDLARRYPVKLVSRCGKRGLASAVIDGMKAAPADAFIVMDGDLSHPPELLPYLRQGLQSYDIVVASRYIDGGGVKGWPWHRQVISRVACKMAGQLTAVKDSSSGYFAVKASVLQDVDLSPIGFKILLECLVKAPYYTWTEIPYTFVERRRGSSKMGAGVCVGYIKHLIALHKFMGQTILQMAKSPSNDIAILQKIEEEHPLSSIIHATNDYIDAEKRARTEKIKSTFSHCAIRIIDKRVMVKGRLKGIISPDPSFYKKMRYLVVKDEFRTT